MESQLEKELSMRWRTMKRIANYAGVIRPGLIWYASGVQIVMGGLLAFGPGEASGATAASAVTSLLGGPRVAGVTLILAAILALIGLYKHQHPTMRALLFSLLQQSTLIVSAEGAFTAIINSQYADGVPRPWDFIAADQSPYLWAVILYTLALLGHHVLIPLIEVKEAQESAITQPAL